MKYPINLLKEKAKELEGSIAYAQKKQIEIKNESRKLYWESQQKEDINKLNQLREAIQKLEYEV